MLRVKPDTERAVTPTPDASIQRTIDLEHLERQTLYDKALQNEVLGLFHQQLLSARSAIPAATGRERLDLAHSLTGAARSVGAFSLADALEAFQDAPFDPKAAGRVLDLIDRVIETVDAIRALSSEKG
ncbi:hypothetical protein GCM10023174_07350 [Chelativorans composti]|jgi:FOG: HPt domain